VTLTRLASQAGARDGEHPGEALGRAPVTGYGQAAVTFGAGERLAAEGDGAQGGAVGLEGDGGLLDTAADDVDGGPRWDEAEPLAIDPQRERRRGRRGGIEDRLQGQQQRIDAQLGGGCGFLLGAPAAKLEQDRLERPAAAGELVDSDAGGRVEDVAADDARALKLVQPLGEDVRADPVQAGPQLDEPFRPEDQLADDQQRPPVADDVEGAGDPAGVVVAAGTRRSPWTCPVPTSRRACPSTPVRSLRRSATGMTWSW